MNRSSGRSSSQKQQNVNHSAIGGIYVLILTLVRAKHVTVGKIGTIEFARGFYAYVGSAMGPGGFKRVERHLDVGAGRKKTRKWHIDHLLALAEIIAVWKVATHALIECEIARSLAANPMLTSINGFGSSDCSCSSHLFCATQLQDLNSAMQKLIEDHREELSGAVSIDILKEDCTDADVAR